MTLSLIPARLLAAALAAACCAAAQQQPIAFTNATLIPIDGPVVEGGTLVVHDGKMKKLNSLALC